METERNIKIVIEGWKSEPVVLENVEDFTVCTKVEGKGRVTTSCSPAFLGWAICSLMSDFKHMNDMIKTNKGGEEPKC
mgnify:FL=1